MSTPYPKLPVYSGPSVKQKQEGQELKKRIEDTAARLKEAYQDEQLASNVPCGLTGEARGAAMHGGDCAVCHKAHSVARTKEAEQEAALLYADVKANGVGGKPSSKLYDDKGNMFGVLLCVDKDGNTQVLKAFSGGYANEAMYEAPGWCPIVPYDKPAQNAELGREFERAEKNLQEVEKLAKEARGHSDPIKDLEKSIKANNGTLMGEKGTINAKYKEALRDPKQKLYEARNAEAPNEEAIAGLVKEVSRLELAQAEAIKQLTEENAANLKKMQLALEAAKKSQAEYEKAYELQHKEKPGKLQEKVQQATREFKQASARLREDESTNRTLTNYKQEQANFVGACRPHAPGGKTGWCAAPKLLAEAKRQGLTPISMAEFWMGKPVAQNQDGDLVPSCDSCRAFLGFALCGLEEAQTAKAKDLTA